jgi:superfamily II DNA helicase RecQ
MQLGSVISRMKQQPLIIALTATATTEVSNCICDWLQVPSSSIVRAPPHRKNLRLHASRELNRELAIKKLLTTGAMKGFVCSNILTKRFPN